MQSNFAQGGQYLHLAWEVYIDQEVEGRLRRAGKLPRDKAEVVFRDSKIVVKDREPDPLSTADIKDLASLREALDIRARAFMMLGICEYGICNQLTERYISLLRQTPVEGMRSSTINEVRRTDRLIFEEVLKWVSKGYGVISDGVKNYLDKPADNLCMEALRTPVGVTSRPGFRTTSGSCRWPKEKVPRDPGGSKRIPLLETIVL